MPFILTFDDSPSEKTLGLLAFLEKYNLKAVFFCVGKNLEKNIDVGIKILEHNHIIANHSYSHKRFSRIENIAEEIRKTDKIINDIYEKVNKRFDEKYFRFPYQDKGVGWNPIKILFRHYSQKFILAQSTLKALGYKNFPSEFNKSSNPLLHIFMNDIDVFTNLNFKDWKTQKIKNILNRIDKLDINKNYILQLHDKNDTYENSIKILKKMIERKAVFVLPKG